MITMSDWVFSILVCTCASLIAVYVYVRRNYNYWKKLGVKELKPSFPFGNIMPYLFLKVSIHDFLDQTYKKGEGEKMIGFYVFDKPYLMLRDPDLLRMVFIKDFNLFTNKLLCDNKNDPFGSAMLFLASNPPWKNIRQNMTPMFTSGKLKKNFELMSVIYEDFENHLKELQVNEKVEKTIEVKDLCAKLMTDIIGIVAYNVRFNSLNDPEAEFRKFGKSMVRTDLLRYFQFSSILFIPQLRSITNAKFFDIGTDFFKNTFSRIVDERVKSGVKKNDFVDLVIDMINKYKSSNSNNIEQESESWMAQLSGMFSAGFETSSTTTSFTIYELATHPEVQKKLRSELLNAMDKTNGKLTYELVTTLPYLNMVVLETMRLYPILSWIDRLAEVDYTFPGTNVTIKKGTPIIFPIRSIQKDPKHHKNPETYDPERFSEENKANIAPFTYAPFGEGPRNCIGSRLGLLQVKRAVAHIFSNYEVSPCDDTCIPMQLDKFNALVHPNGALNLNFKRLSL